MNSLKKLAGDTAIYGVSSIVGRFLNWWLVPYYSHVFLTADYGIVTNLYAYMAFFMVVLTYGMETGFFRFASKSEDKDLVYSSSMLSIVTTTVLFLIVIFGFKQTLASWLDYQNHPEYIQWIAIILALDVVSSIPFAKLRIESRPIKFAVIKLINIFVNIFSNIFFITICPTILKTHPESIVRYIYSPEIGVGYVFISNLFASFISFVLLIPEMRFRLKFNPKLLKEIIWYSFPILIVGVAGMVNQNIDKILLPKLIPADQNPMAQLGIYGANYKLAVLMNMFIQAFRYAFEPFFFSQAKSENNKKGYALVLKYFVIFGLVIFLGVSLFLDLFRQLHIIDKAYYSGLSIVPIVLLANLFLGIYYTLSLWYKLTDKTRFGAYFAIIGAVISISLNVIFVPIWGYKASAVAVFICFLIMAVLSYLIGQKYYRVNYPIGRIAVYFISALVLFFIGQLKFVAPGLLTYAFHAVLLLLFFILIVLLEKAELQKFLFNKRN